MIKKICYVLIASIHTAFIKSAIIISGQPNTQGMPFPFTVGPTAYDPLKTTLFIGASQAITEEQFQNQAISVVARDATEVRGITPERVTLNNSGNQLNPLYGKQIAFIALSGENPFVVTAAENTRISFIRSGLSASPSVLQSSPLKNITDVTGGIVGLTALPGQEASINQNLQVPSYENFFAAIRPAVGDFGQIGSGIASGQVYVVNNAKEGQLPILEYHLEQMFFAPLDITSPSVAVNSPLASIDNDTLGKPVIMKNFIRHNNLFTGLPNIIYTGLFVTGGPSVNDGALGVVLNANRPITFPSALESDSIIGGIGANTQVSIHFMETMLTSTQLLYLVVVGGVGSPAARTQSVWALPLTQNGMLAKKNAAPETDFTKPPLSVFVQRYFPDSDAARNPGDLFSPTAPDSYKARVGGNGILPGDIIALFTCKDAIFVAIGQDGTNEQGGLFYSQMIFDNLGRANGWTDWQHAYGITTGIANMAFNDKLADFWYFPGNNPQASTFLYRTGWDPINAKLSSFYVDLVSTLAPETGGIQGLLDVNKQHPSLSQTVGKRISLMIATGFNQVVMAESGADDGPLFVALTGISSEETFTDGTLTGLTTPTQKILMSGGALQKIGAITTAAIISDDTYSWLIVGGSGGVAVLANPDGSGWNKGTLEKGFVNLPATLSWRTLGDFAFVRKIVADTNGLLYILSNDELSRITASAENFITLTPANIATLADRTLLEPFGNKFSSFSDLVVSGKFATVATSVGLFRVGNGADISQAANQEEVAWTNVAMPESSGSATRFFLIPPSSATNSFADDPRGAGLYVVNATTSDLIGRIYRFALAGSINETGITDATMQIPNDLFVKNRPSLYLNCSIYVNYVFTDGAFLGITRSAYFPDKHPSFFEIVNPRIRTGVRKATIESFVYTTPGVRMGPIVRRSATGSVVAAGSALLVGE